MAAHDLGRHHPVEVRAPQSKCTASAKVSDLEHAVITPSEAGIQPPPVEEKPFIPFFCTTHLLTGNKTSNAAQRSLFCARRGGARVQKRNSTT